MTFVTYQVRNGFSLYKTGYSCTFILSLWNRLVQHKILIVGQMRDKRDNSWIIRAQRQTIKKFYTGDVLNSYDCTECMFFLFHNCDAVPIETA